MCGSRKYPYPTTVGQWKFLRGGGLKVEISKGYGGLGTLKNFQEA